MRTLFDTNVIVATLDQLHEHHEWSVRALDALETLEALSRFAAIGGAGARLYDYLIGHVAVVASAGRIVTWNVRHLRPLFPTLEVLTPKEAIGT